MRLKDATCFCVSIDRRLETQLTGMVQKSCAASNTLKREKLFRLQSTPLRVAPNNLEISPAVYGTHSYHYNRSSRFELNQFCGGAQR